MGRIRDASEEREREILYNESANKNYAMGRMRDAYEERDRKERERERGLL